LLELTGEVLVPRTVLNELARGPIDISGLEFSVEQVDIDTESVYPHLIRERRPRLWSVPNATRYS
jgi:hypothetical protein